jgi:hypothetical protein
MFRALSEQLMLKSILKANGLETLPSHQDIQRMSRQQKEELTERQQEVIADFQRKAGLRVANLYERLLDAEQETKELIGRPPVRTEASWPPPPAYAPVLDKISDLEKYIAGLLS